MVEIEKELENLIRKAKEMGSAVLDFPGEFRIISHHDADGIASAAIMVKALLREGKPFHLTFLKQLTEEYVKELADEGKKFFIFTDMGSGHLNAIQEYLVGGAKIAVIDHHQV